ncbi:MAG: hypothetical protein K9J06_04490 [Flavobacteriales bacterium]|nr:hypothetical protein [Flavobacteriales bacterium]
MRIAVDYLNDSDGNVKAVQLPLRDWQKVLAELKRYEQALKLRSDLKDALKDVEKMRAGKASKQTLHEFLADL